MANRLTRENLHVAEIALNGEPQLKHRFHIVLPLIPVGGYDKAEVARRVSTRLQNIGPVLSLSMETEAGPSQNSNWYFMKGDDCEEFTMTFFEFEDQWTLEYFMSWRALQINSDGTYNPPAKYKQTIMVCFLDSRMSKIVREIKLKRCHINSISIADGNYDGTEVQQVEVGITYDGPETRISNVLI